MGLRERVNEELKTSMKAGDSARTSTLRMVLARLKDTDIAARPKGISQVADDEIISMLRSMVKSRRESIDLYRQGNRPDLVAKESAEIDVIQGFLPAQMDTAAMEQAVAAAVQDVQATGIKDMGKVIAALKAKHGTQLDMSIAGPVVRTRLQAL